MIGCVRFNDAEDEYFWSVLAGGLTMWKLNVCW